MKGHSVNLFSRNSLSSRSHGRTLLLGFAVWLISSSHQLSWCEQTSPTDRLPNTALLEETEPLDEVMVAGIDRFALKEIQRASQQRIKQWDQDVLQAENQSAAFKQKRAEFSQLIGCIDTRIPANGIHLVSQVDRSALIVSNDLFEILHVKWPVLEGLEAEGYFLRPKSKPIARIVAIPDAQWTPEQICGLSKSPTRYAADLAALGCEVLVPAIVNRSNEFSANPTIGRSTNLSHREFLYRQAFELGRHIIGYEVQKILAAVDQFEFRNSNEEILPIGVCGVSEGGLLAFYSAAIDERIDGALVSGYFNQRDEVWKEPIYRNVWRLLVTFGDAQIASMIAPRELLIEVDPIIPIPSPLPDRGRKVAAPGEIARPDRSRVEQELTIARKAWDQVEALSSQSRGRLVAKNSDQDSKQPIGPTCASQFVQQLTKRVSPSLAIQSYNLSNTSDVVNPLDRQQRMVKAITRYTQRKLQLSQRERDKIWSPLNRTSVEEWKEDSGSVRSKMHEELIGRLPKPTLPIQPRTRRIITDQHYDAYEVVLDVYPDVIASGILLLPKGIKEGEKRPVVVCQHGLEGTPMDTIHDQESRGYRAYKSFSVQLVKEGFIVYAPQNPYRGKDAFRTLQRKSNPLGRTLFSYIIPQHLVTLRWLSQLPSVDADRIGFYGLSYGGKTAVRVPPFLPPTEDEPGYALSICSADFNEWVSKNASTDAPFSYVWTPEYEIFEWNMGNLANYAELAMLMSPRPFMVERGHDDGVGIDEWVAWEFAKVRRHYAKLGIANQTEIEFFNGPHTINGKGTFDFLKRHLDL